VCIRDNDRFPEVYNPLSLSGFFGSLSVEPQTSDGFKAEKPYKSTDKNAASLRA
jgi:hypothetical protein